jgi:apolipoprotein N-acyltransferase
MMLGEFTQIVTAVGVLLITALVFFIGALLLKLADAKQDAERRRWVLYAIVTAFKASEWSVTTVGTWLDGQDRAVVARLVWGYLPPEAQKLLPYPEYERLVGLVYDDAVQLWKRNETLFSGKVEELLERQ